MGIEPTSVPSVRVELRNGNLLQYSCLENPMDRGAWQAPVHGVIQSLTQHFLPGRPLPAAPILLITPAGDRGLGPVG